MKILKIRRSRLARKIRELRFLRVRVRKPSSSLFVIFLIAASIFVFGGGIYDILMKPHALLPAPGHPVFLYPGLHEQTWNESLQAIFLFTLGIIGCFLIFKSSRYVYKPRSAAMLLLIGVLMLVSAFAICELFIGIKGGWIRPQWA